MNFPCRVGRDKQRNPHCIRSSETECDLTNELETRGVYSADVLSESTQGSSDYVEPPYTRSKKFCPYNDSECPTLPPSKFNQFVFKAVDLIFVFLHVAIIGRPEFKLKVNENKKIVLIIQDPITALHKDGRSLNIRDIFKKNLKYKIAYNKAGSTGKVSISTFTSYRCY